MRTERDKEQEEIMTTLETILTDYQKCREVLEKHGHKLAPGEPLHEKVINLIAIINGQRELLEAKNKKK